MLVGTIPDLLASFDGEHNGQRLFGSGSGGNQSQGKPAGDPRGTRWGNRRPDGADGHRRSTTNPTERRGAVGRGGQQRLRHRREQPIPKSRNEPEVTVSHSPATEPSPEVEAPSRRSASARRRSSRRGAAARSSRPPPTWPRSEDPHRAGSGRSGPADGGAAPHSDIVTALAYLFIALTDDSVSLVSDSRAIFSRCSDSSRRWATGRPPR